MVSCLLAEGYCNSSSLGVSGRCGFSFRGLRWGSFGGGGFGWGGLRCGGFGWGGSFGFWSVGCGGFGLGFFLLGGSSFGGLGLLSWS